MQAVHSTRRWAILLAGSLLLGTYGPDAARAADYDGIKSLDSFQRRWQEHHRDRKYESTRSLPVSSLAPSSARWPRSMASLSC